MFKYYFPVCNVLGPNVVYCHFTGIYIPEHVYPKFLVSIAKTSGVTQTFFLGHIPLATVLFFHISQYFTFACHISCILQLNVCFSYVKWS